MYVTFVKMTEYMIVRTRKFQKRKYFKTALKLHQTLPSVDRKICSVPSQAKASDSEWFLGLLRDLVQVMSGPSLEKSKKINLISA